eukprot:g12005.t1
MSSSCTSSARRGPPRRGRGPAQVLSSCLPLCLVAGDPSQVSEGPRVVLALGQKHGGQETVREALLHQQVSRLRSSFSADPEKSSLLRAGSSGGDSGFLALSRLGLQDKEKGDDNKSNDKHGEGIDEDVHDQKKSSRCFPYARSWLALNPPGDAEKLQDALRELEPDAPSPKECEEKACGSMKKKAVCMFQQGAEARCTWDNEKSKCEALNKGGEKSSKTQKTKKPSKKEDQDSFLEKAAFLEEGRGDDDDSPKTKAADDATTSTKATTPADPWLQPESVKDVPCATVKKWGAQPENTDTKCYDYGSGRVFDEHANCTAGAYEATPRGISACFASPGEEENTAGKDANGNKIWVSHPKKLYFGKAGDPDSYQSCCVFRKKDAQTHVKKLIADCKKHTNQDDCDADVNCKFGLPRARIDSDKTKSGDEVGDSNTTGSNTTGSNTKGSNTTDSNTTDSNTTDSNTTDSNTTDSNTTDKGGDKDGDKGGCLLLVLLLVAAVLLLVAVVVAVCCCCGGKKAAGGSGGASGEQAKPKDDAPKPSEDEDEEDEDSGE